MWHRTATQRELQGITETDSDRGGKLKSNRDGLDRKSKFDADYVRLPVSYHICAIYVAYDLS